LAQRYQVAGATSRYLATSSTALASPSSL